MITKLAGLLSIFFLAEGAWAQETAKEVFAPLDQKITEAKGQYADIYAPKFYSDGMVAY